MTTVLQERWATRALVGDKRHVQIVRLRPGYMKHGYLDELRIDDGSTPFNGAPIYPPLIWKGDNHHCWKAVWTPTGDWMTLPNVQSTKWGRDFDVQTGGQKGSATLTVVMDNIAFIEEAGVAGVYHAIERGHFSPQRGFTPKGRANHWPGDTSNSWRDVLDGGYQIELWEGYGTGSDVELRTVLDPTTNSYAPASGALDRTFTGLVIDCDSESHPDQITLTVQDFAILLTDQRVLGDNKAPECRSPVTFADRRQTQGENKITGPLDVSDGQVSEDGHWTSASAPAYIEIGLKPGYYEDFFVAPVIAGAVMQVSLYMGSGAGLCDYDDAHTLPRGAWVNLGGVGTGVTPDGVPYMWQAQLGQYAQRWYLGHGFDVPLGSKLRLTFTSSPGTLAFHAYQFGSNPAKAMPGGLAGVVGGAKGWILVDDASSVVRMTLIWCGFQEWHVEEFNWSLWKPMVYGEDKFFIDIITDMLQQGLFIFYMGPPTNDDRSIGVPHFEHIKAIDQPNVALEVRDTDMTEALDVKTDLSSLPWVMRYRGKIDDKTGVTFGQDLSKRVQATYYPPWTGRYQPLGVAPGLFGLGGLGIRLPPSRVAGVRRHFTETMSLTLVVALTTVEECLFACLLAAIQYGLGMRMGQFQIPGLSRLNLNDQISVIEEAMAVNSRIWVTSVESEHVNGGADNQGHWTMTISGSLVDTEEMDWLINDYNYAYPGAQRMKTGW